MPTTNVKTIGGTTPDYATIALWEAAIPANLITTDEIWRGECRDVTFSEADVALGSGVTTDATRYPILTREAGSNWDGTIANGPVVDEATGTATTNGYGLLIDCDFFRVVGIRVSNSQTKNTGNSSMWACIATSAGPGADSTIAQCICHDANPTDYRTYALHHVSEPTSADTYNWLNNQAINLGASGDRARAIAPAWWMTGITMNMIGNVVFNSDWASGFGMYVGDDGGSACTANVYNNVMFSNGGGVGYVTAGFGSSTLNATNNGSSDTTTPGTSTFNSLTQATELVSVTGGSEDLHLDSGSTILGDGSDRGTTPTLVEIDIDGYDRDAGGDTWDIGSDQFGKPAAAVAFWVNRRTHKNPLFTLLRR